MNKAELIKILSERAKHFGAKMCRVLSTPREDGENYGYMSAYQSCIALVEQFTEPQWISVSERLPNADEWKTMVSDAVLVTVQIKGGNHKFVATDCYNFEDGLWGYERGEYKIIGWMPKPEPMK